MAQNHQLAVLVGHILRPNAGNGGDIRAAAIVHGVGRPLDSCPAAVFHLEAVIAGLGKTSRHTGFSGRLVKYAVHNQRPAGVPVHDLHAGVFGGLAVQLHIFSQQHRFHVVELRLIAHGERNASLDVVLRKIEGRAARLPDAVQLRQI